MHLACGFISTSLRSKAGGLPLSFLVLLRGLRQGVDGAGDEHCGVLPEHCFSEQ